MSKPILAPSFPGLSVHPYPVQATQAQALGQSTGSMERTLTLALLALCSNREQKATDG